MTLKDMKMDLSEMNRLIALKENAIKEEDKFFQKIKGNYGITKICDNRHALLGAIKIAIADEVMK